MPVYGSRARTRFRTARPRSARRFHAPDCRTARSRSRSSRPSAFWKRRSPQRRPRRIRRDARRFQRDRRRNRRAHTGRMRQEPHDSVPLARRLRRRAQHGAPAIEHRLRRRSVSANLHARRSRRRVEFAARPHVSLQCERRRGRRGNDPLAALPVRGSARRYRLSIVLLPDDAARHTLNSTPDFAEIDRIMLPILPKGTRLSSMRWSSVYRVSHRIAQNYARGRVFSRAMPRISIRPSAVRA